MEKYGFVYVWYNRWKKKFYVGCHWGREDDGYVCSSKLMREAYKRNPEYFKRRIVVRITTSRRDMMQEEFRWLSMIDTDELGKKYYNLNKHHFGHWSLTEESSSVVQEKRKKRVGWKNPPSQETIEKRRAKAIGSKRTDEQKLRMSLAHRGKPKSKEAIEKRTATRLANKSMNKVR